MDKSQHITYWKESADKDWIAANGLIQSKNYFHALFFFHLTIEKLVKACWVMDNVGNTPPLSHDTIYLLGQTNVEMETDMLDLMRLVNTWNIETRYPDYKFSLYKQATKQYTLQKQNQVSTLRQCLLEKL